jgi:hypothetical protein
MSTATKASPAAQSITANDILWTLDGAAEWADGIDVDYDVMVPIIRAVRKRFPQLLLIDAELALADARREIAPKIDDLVSFRDLRRCFKNALERDP